MNETALSNKEKTVFLLLIVSVGIIYLDLLPLRDVFLAAVVIVLLMPAIGAGRPLLFPRKHAEDKAIDSDMPLAGQQHRQQQEALRESYRRTYEGDQHRAGLEVQRRERQTITKINPDYYRPEVALSRFAPSNKTVVIGIGCAGINSVNHMVDTNLSGIDTVAIDSDLQKLHSSKADCSIFIGDQKDLIAELMDQVADDLQQVYHHADTVVLLVGLDGKTGTVVAPLIAREAKHGNLAVHLFAIEPFEAEGKAKSAASSAVLSELTDELNSVVTLSKQFLMEALSSDDKFITSISAGHKMLRRMVTDLNHRLRLINSSFFLPLNAAGAFKLPIQVRGIELWT